MLGTINLAAFISAGIILNIYPGPDNMYIIARSMQGTRAGIISALGIVAGAMVLCLASGLGLSSLLAASPAAYMTVQGAGAIYMTCLGIRSLTGRAPGRGSSATYLSSLTDWQIFRQGFLTDLLNPKVVLFFISFLPQFVDPARNHGFLTFIFLGCIFITTGSAWCILLAVFASKAADFLRKKAQWIRRLEIVTGILFLLLAANAVRELL
jgi:threonine/homoserine/homoserine lactone efflux protein